MLDLSLDLLCRVIKWDCRMFLVILHPKVTSWPLLRHSTLVKHIVQYTLKGTEINQTMGEKSQSVY